MNNSEVSRILQLTRPMSKLM